MKDRTIPFYCSRQIRVYPFAEFLLGVNILKKISSITEVLNQNMQALQAFQIFIIWVVENFRCQKILKLQPHFTFKQVENLFESNVSSTKWSNFWTAKVVSTNVNDQSFLLHHFQLTYYSSLDGNKLSQVWNVARHFCVLLQSCGEFHSW